MTARHGFTILELSIVLVIIALLTGGILLGKELIRNSEIRSALEESQLYTQALDTFQKKYGALPGDFNRATEFWGAANGVPAVCIVTVVNPGATCNGDSDGWITNQLSSATFFEQFRAWQHLKLANMISDHISSPKSATGGDQRKVVGENIPPSRLTGAGWGVLGLPVDYVVNYDSLVDYKTNDFPPNHVLILGADYWSANTRPAQQPVLTPTEAKSMDDKVDDGRPMHGKLVVQKDWIGSPCHTTSASTTVYLLTATDTRCTMIFKTGL